MIWLYYIFITITLILAFISIYTHYKRAIMDFIKTRWNIIKYDWGIFLYLVVGLSAIAGNFILLYNGLITSSDFVNINTMITLVSCVITISSISYR